MEQNTRISFVRHGLVHNPDQIIYGRMPGFGLSPSGYEDARRAANALKDQPVKALYCSPLLRTQQTAREILKYHPHVKMEESSLLTEVRGAFEGQKESVLEAVGMDVFHDKDPQWEQPGDILQRTRQFIQKVRQAHPGDHTAAVTHGDVILFLLFWANRCAVTPENKLNLKETGILREYPGTGSITTLTYTSDDPGEMPAVSYHHPVNPAGQR